MSSDLVQILTQQTQVLVEDKRWRGVNSDWRERAALLLSWTFAALADTAWANDGLTVVRLDELEDLFGDMRSAEAMASGIEDPVLRQKMRVDWQELLGCPWSPVPLLDDLLADESWTEVDVSAEAIVRSFCRAADELMAS